MKMVQESVSLQSHRLMHIFHFLSAILRYYKLTRPHICQAFMSHSSLYCRAAAQQWWRTLGVTLGVSRPAISALSCHCLALRVMSARWTWTHKIMCDTCVLTVWHNMPYISQLCKHWFPEDFQTPVLSGSINILSGWPLVAKWSEKIN